MTAITKGRTGPLLTAGVVLGIGLGGFIDGLVAHQLLQWHHMLTATGDHPATTVAGLETNTLWDGIFHASTWAAMVIGLALLWRAGERRDVLWSRNVLLGALAVGWGLFNLVEGIVDHHILGIHHVRDDVANPLPWDLGFLAFGALLVAVGWLLIRAGQPRESRESASTITDTRHAPSR